MLKRPASDGPPVKSETNGKQRKIDSEIQSTKTSRVSQLHLCIYWDSAWVVQKKSNVSIAEVRSVLADKLHLPIKQILLQERKFHIAIEYMFPADDEILGHLRPEDWKFIVKQLIAETACKLAEYNPVTVSSGRVVVCVLACGSSMRTSEAALTSKLALVTAVTRGSPCCTPGCNRACPLQDRAVCCASCPASNGVKHADFCEERLCALSHTSPLATLKTLLVRSEVHLMLEARIEHPDPNIGLSDEILASLANVLRSRRVYVPDTIEQVATIGRFTKKIVKEKPKVACWLCQTKAMEPWTWFSHARTASHTAHTRKSSCIKP